MLPRPLRVSRIRRETRDTFSIEIGASNRTGVLEYKPGQFNMLYAFGVGEVPISISGAGLRRGFFVHTLRNVGPVTGSLVRTKAGDEIGLRGPFGNAWPLEEAEGKDVIIMAGGIGLAPLRPAIYHILGNRGRYGCVSVLYGARSPSDILYRRELERWRQHLDVAVTVDRSEKNWRGPVGVVTALLAGIRLDPRKTLAFLCGPEVMIRFCSGELGKLGIAPARIYLSLERNMKCAVGLCGHCQFGPEFICRDGPIFTLERMGRWLTEREL